jgi:anti-sigma factor RsiW
MPELEQTMTRYLLGELSEAEQTALEQKYFADSTLFDQLTRVESDLIDDYARGRLSSPMRARFEQYYLSDPNRRARLKFGQAFVTRLAEMKPSGSARVAAPQVSWWEQLRVGFRRPSPVLAFSAALAGLLLIGAVVWLLVDSARLRRQLSEAQASGSSREKTERELKEQIAAERARTDQLTADLDRLRSQQLPSPSPPSQIAPTVASLVLAISGVRSGDTGSPATLVIPQGTDKARFQLILREGGYKSYTAVIQTADGKQFFKSGSLIPGNRTHPSLAFIVPAARFSEGDYILTLKGITSSGEAEDVSKSLFRVEKK